MQHRSTLTESSTEQWCKELDKCQRRQMTKDETDTLLRAILAENQKLEYDDYDKWVKSNDNMVAMIHKRIKYCHTYTASQTVVIFLAYLCDSPGMAVQYCNFIQYKCHQNKCVYVDMFVFSRNIFPWGFFTDADLQQMWDKQKAYDDNGSFNMLDNSRFMQSIHKLN